jgi:DNA-binding response OmpR family regulator
VIFSCPTTQSDSQETDRQHRCFFTFLTWYKAAIEIKAGGGVLMSCSILLVEDEPVARRNISLFLQQAKHRVHQAETGEAAVSLISRMQFDNVICDFRLPGKINGVDVLKRQQETLPGKRLVLITAFGSDEVRAEAEALGAVYMEKPLSLADLLSNLDTIS